MKVRALLLPLVPLYGFAVALKNWAYDRGLLHARALSHPVISVGNVSTGGTGKTPFVLALVELLQRRGASPIVLSRGYGRRSNAVERVQIESVAGEGPAAQYGDEPLLIARRSGVPVFVGAQRFAAGAMAEKELALTSFSASAVFMLDDGFQHRQLRRNVDIVLVTRENLQDHLLPAGDLRDSLTSLRRAQILVVKEHEAAAIKEAIGAAIADRVFSAQIVRIRRSVDVAAIPEGARVLAFCGIAHPEEFFDSLRAHGVALAETIAFRDHHAYGAADIARLAEVCQNVRATHIATTEKDEVKITAEFRAELARAAPLAVVPLRTEVLDADVLLDHVLAACGLSSL